MRDGIPLDDSDRAPWLDSLRNQLLSTLEAGHHPVLACSALKQQYRAHLLEGMDGISIIYLKGNYELIFARMSNRKGHYMKPEMLQSQFDALEEPKAAVVLNAGMSLEEMIDTIMRKFYKGF
jgi:carbohydrate kinase (thermoresistant glucokinase family)